MQKLGSFLERGGCAAHGLKVSDDWREADGILTHTKIHQRVLGITVDRPPVAVGVTIECLSAYNYDPRQDALHVEESVWQISAGASAACATYMCTRMQQEIRVELTAECRCKENHDRPFLIAVEAEIREAMRNWTGEPFTSLLAGHVDPEGIASFISQIRQLCEVCMCEWLKSHNDQGGIE